MSIRMKARTGESAEQLMRRFKKLCEKEGLTKDLKRRAHYEKPSEKKQRALRKMVKRAQALAGLLPPPPKGKKGGPGSRGPGGPGGPRRGGGDRGMD